MNVETTTEIVFSNEDLMAILVEHAETKLGIPKIQTAQLLSRLERKGPQHDSVDVLVGVTLKIRREP